MERVSNYFFFILFALNNNLNLRFLLNVEITNWFFDIVKEFTELIDLFSSFCGKYFFDRWRGIVIIIYCLLDIFILLKDIYNRDILWLWRLTNFTN